MYLAKYLVQGADIWLNTPRRPFEACGTSGMKAALNGVLNVSILDGWWAEAYNEAVGWRIGNGEEHGDPNYLDAIEAQALYNVLENDVIGGFYERRNGYAPAGWIRMMKESMKMAMEHFCSLRMVETYCSEFYAPAAQRFDELGADKASEARRLSRQHARLRSQWKNIRVSAPVRGAVGPFRVGDAFRITSVVQLGDLRPEEIDVQLYYGLLKSIDTVVCSQTQMMDMQESLGNGEYLYACDISCRHSGRYGFTTRVIPRGDDWIKNTPGLITWAEKH